MYIGVMYISIAAFVAGYLLADTKDYIIHPLDKAFLVFMALCWPAMVALLLLFVITAPFAKRKEVTSD